MKKFVLGHIDDCGEFQQIHLPSIKIYFFRNKLYNFLDRDTKHAIVCKIIHRHKRKADNLLIDVDGAGHVDLSVFDKWNCIRCGEEMQIKFMINSRLLDAINNETKEFMRTTVFPPNMYSIKPDKDGYLSSDQ